MFVTDKVEVKLRLPQEVKEKLQKEAEKQKRSLNNLLEVIIEEYLK
ncbi:MAG: Arc family DNA-binding protein [Ruminococcaceae bacterium]|nr:Arc family DNA-binding protein [Oscillospiraceae bacterium]